MTMQAAKQLSNDAPVEGEDEDEGPRGATVTQ